MSEIHRVVTILAEQRFLLDQMSARQVYCKIERQDHCRHSPLMLQPGDRTGCCRPERRRPTYLQVRLPLPPLFRWGGHLPVVTPPSDAAALWSVDDGATPVPMRGRPVTSSGRPCPRVPMVGQVMQQPSLAEVAEQPGLAEPPHPLAAMPDAGVADRDSGFVQPKKRYHKHASRVNAATPSSPSHAWGPLPVRCWSLYP